MTSPCCGQPAEVFTHIGNEDIKPNPNDPIICFQCCAWLVVTATGLRLFDVDDLLRHTDEELNVLRRLTDLLKAFKRANP